MEPVVAPISWACTTGMDISLLLGIRRQPTEYVQISPGTKSIDLYLNVIKVCVQIGPGWVE